jgi:copper chaperone CopZ
MAGRRTTSSFIVAVALGLAVPLVVAAGRPGSARAELMAVSQVAIGMECAECARTLRLAVKQLAGVDDASTSWNRRILAVRLTPGNACSLQTIRALLRKNHFVPGEAEIIVAGRLTRAPNGNLSLAVDGGSGVVFPIDAQSARASAIGDIPDGATVRIRGRVAGEPPDSTSRAPAALALGIIDVSRIDSAPAPHASAH